MPHFVSQHYDDPSPLPDASAHPTTTPFAHSFFRNLARDWILWPDPEIRWARRAAAQLKSIDIDADWVLTTSPPESLHAVGPQLKEALGCRWIAEFRDTWTVAPHRAALAKWPWRRMIERNIARKCLKSADAISSVSEAVLSEVRNYVPAGTPEYIINHFADAPPAPAKLPKADLNIVHSGGFSLSDRRRKLSDALQVLDSVNAQRPDHRIHLHIAGQLSPAENRLINARSDKDPSLAKVTRAGSVSLMRSRALQAGADALLLHTPEDSHALPGKYAEYRQTRVPILYLGGGDWLSLVDDPKAIQPLGTGLMSLQKGDTVPNACAPGFSADAAANALVEFLQGIITTDD